MPILAKARSIRWLLFLGFAALTLPSAGCLAAAVTAGVVGAGAAGYAYYQGSANRDFPANMDRTWAAVDLALKDLGMPIETGSRDHEAGYVESHTGDGYKVKISLEPRPAAVPADGQSTRVTVRVAMFGDGPVTERILNQIETRLAPPPGAGQQVPVINGPPSH